MAWLGVLFGAVLVLSNCARAAESSSRQATTDDRPTITIAWIVKTLGNPVFDLGRAGALQKAHELSAVGPYNVEVIVTGSVDADAMEQARVIEDVLARGVDGIAVSCNDPTACIDPINQAVAAGIPVMTWDSDAPQSERFMFLSIDNYAAGQQAGLLLAEALDGRGKVAVLTGVPGGLNLEERVQGFRDALADYPQIEIVGTIFTNEDINQGVDGVEEVMRTHPDLNGWFFAGMWPLFADRGSMPLWEEATRERGLKTVAFDTLPVQLDLLKDGYLTALIGQKYWDWGYESVQIVYDRIVYNVTFPDFIDTGTDIVTSNNVEAMEQAWRTNDFSRPLPPP
ncbi:MAG: sugar ABC transporter substrate-binding protein [Chloroflexaceae bacterium]|nr:sugar ABC transporter substrate-binding protein [Chloroflexaceae bacterium]